MQIIPIGIYLFCQLKASMSKAARTKAYIIEKTAPIFNKKGFAGTSLADMTAATGLTKGSIYGNFANKDEVALAVFDYNFKRISSAIVKEMAKKTNAKDKLMVFAAFYSQVFEPPLDAGGCAVLNTAVEADDTHDGLKKKASQAVMSWKATIMEVVQQGIARKELQASLDPEQVALTIIALFEGGIMIAKLLESKTAMRMIMDSMQKMIEGWG